MPSSATSATVGRRIREARERLGLTQAELGAQLTKTATAISYWESGARSPGLDDLVDLASVLGISTADLLPAQEPRVLVRAEARLLAIEDLEEAVDRVVARFADAPSPGPVPRAPSSNPAEAAGFARRRAEQRSAPIDVEAVLRECGCHYTEAALTQGLQGFVVVADSTPIVVSNQQDLPTRRRFTAAHELGHVLLRHHDSFHVDFDVAEGSPPTYNWRHERAANDFAASLLMPEELLREAVESSIIIDAGSLADAFNVSRQAMSIRLASLRLVS